MNDETINFRVEPPRKGDAFTLTIYGNAELQLKWNQSRFRITYDKMENGSAMFTLKRPMIHRKIRFIAISAKRINFDEVFLNTAAEDPVICCFVDKCGNSSEQFTAMLTTDDISTIA